MERNIYSIMYIFLFKYNSEYINGFCKLFLNETIIKLNNKEVSTNYYMNLFERLIKSFRKIDFNIKNIKMIDNNNAEVKYSFWRIFYVKYFLNLDSYSIEPNNQIIETDIETMNIKLDNEGHVLELFI